MTQRRMIPLHDIPEIIERYRRGVKINDLALDYGVTRGAIYKLLRRENVADRPRRTKFKDWPTALPRRLRNWHRPSDEYKKFERTKPAPSRPAALPVRSILHADRMLMMSRTGQPHRTPIRFARGPI
jgi:hypothetical protein